MPDANAHAPDMRPSIRKAHRDDPVRNALANFCENLDGAQYLINTGDVETAKALVARSIRELKSVLIEPGIEDLTVTVNRVNRLEVYLDYFDDLGKIRMTYTARQPRETYYR